MTKPVFIFLLVGMFGAVLSYRGGPGDGSHPRTGFACEGSTLTIDCGDQGNRKIFVVRANYGRQNIGICNDGGETSGWNLQCISTRAARTVARICNGTQKCSVTASNVHFGGDPCPGTVKYLEIEYNCLGDGELLEQATIQPQTTDVLSSPTTLHTNTTTTSTSSSATTTIKPTTSTATTTTTMTTLWSESIKTKHTPPTKPSLAPTKSTTERMQADPGMPRRFCSKQKMRNVQWPRTVKGAWAIMPCPNNPDVRRAMWKCGRSTVNWEGLPDLSGCKSPELEDLNRKMTIAREEFSSQIMTEVATDLKQASKKQDLFGGDLRMMSKIMKDMVSEMTVQAQNTTKPVSNKVIREVTESVLNTSSNLLADEREESWTDLPQATQAKTATRMISSVEESAYQLADTYQEPTVVMNVTLNIVLEVNVINVEAEEIDDVVFPKAVMGQEAQGARWLNSGNSIRLTGDSLRQLGVNGLARLIFLTYNNLEKWIQPHHTPAAASYGSYNYDDNRVYQELRGRDYVNFDLNDIETEILETNAVERNDKLLGMDDAQYDVPSDHTTDDNSSDTVKLLDEVGSTMAKKKVEVTTVASQVTDAPATTAASVNQTRIVNSQIISASVLQKESNADGTQTRKKGHIPLSEPVLYTLEHKTTNNVYNPTCSFWEYSEKTLLGRWSTFGCKVKHTNVTHTTCACNHITNFAVLMDVQGVELSEEHQFALAFITYLGCVISIVCLLICFITFAAFKNLQCDRNTIHKNLVLCLLIAEVLFLAGIMQHTKPVLCSVMAGLLHYFFLCAFMWMLMEGVQLYVMLVEVFEAEKSRVKYYYLVSYGSPAIIVAISAAVNHEGYGTESHCWLTTEGGFIWAFVGPVVAIITINIVMLSIAIYQMCKHANAAAAWKMKQKSKMESIRSWVKGASVLVVLLGLTWAFGLLYINEHTTFMAYIFTILNSLQGLFIFIFHCAMNDKVQKEYKRWVRRATWLPETLRVKYGGAKPYASTTPNQSTSSGNKLQSQKTTKTSPERRVSLEYLTKLLSGRRRKRSSTTTMRSSLSNGSKWQYQNMKHDMTSPRESAHMTDSGIGRNTDSLCTTEEQGGYLEPVSIRVNDNLLDDIDADPGFSLMEGSCVDTDCYGYDLYKKPALDVDKYKIKPSNQLSPATKEQPASESDYSDGELKTDSGSVHIYEEIPRTKSEEALFAEMEGEGYNTLLQRKLRQFAQENEDDIPKDVPNMNNLDKGDNGNVAVRDSVLLSMPNIQFTKDNTFKRSLPSLNDNSKPPVVIEKLNKALSTSDDGTLTISRNTDRKSNLHANIQPGHC